MCRLLHQSSISERAVKNKGRSYKPDFLWNLRLKKKKQNRAAVASKQERSPSPHHHLQPKVALVSVNPEDRGLGLGLESCGYCGERCEVGMEQQVSGEFALARSGEVDVQLFVQ